MDGLLLIDKPKDWTSFDVVAKLRGLIRQQTGQKRVKVGHTGTLDPQATGLLVVVIGSYTKKVPELSKADKTYEVVMQLGSTSTTGDIEGDKTFISDAVPSEQDVLNTLSGNIGVISQTPPAYSAIKVNGQRAYKLARAGREVKIEPRKVEIFDIANVEYRYPVVRFSATVSSGTYIRSLVEDIGQQLQTGAFLADLRRTRVGEMKINDAKQITDKDLLSFICTI